MASVADLVEASAIEKLATPSDLRLGREIVAQDGVVLDDFGPLKVVARVGGVPASATRRTVVLEATSQGLTWSCTCTKKAGHFCKHCVAAALVAWDTAPSGRECTLTFAPSPPPGEG